MITRHVVFEGLSNIENPVSNKNGVISWSEQGDISFTLKNLEYDEIYNRCRKEKEYTLLLLDGAIVQLMYHFSNDELISHRLVYMPHPMFLSYSEVPKEYEDLVYGEKYFSDIVEYKSFVSPIRFDFDSDDDKYVEEDHSYSHFTFGNIMNCRIPMSKPLSPKKFIKFILKNFYNELFHSSFTNETFSCNLPFDNLLSEKESSSVHMSH